MSEQGLSGQPVSLVDLLDRVLGKGVVVAGDLMISVADVDLIYVNLRLLISAVETAMRDTQGPLHGLQRT